MKGKLGVVLSICLLTSQVAFAEKGAFGEVGNILFGSMGKYAPNDVRVATVVPAALGVGAGAALYFLNGKIVALPGISRLATLVEADLKVAKLTDILQGLGIVLGVEGVMGLYKGGHEMRDDYLMAVLGAFITEQMLFGNRVKDREAVTAAFAGLAITKGAFPILELAAEKMSAAEMRTRRKN